MPNPSARRRSILAAGALAAVGAPLVLGTGAAYAAAETPTGGLTPSEALARLLAGNHRFRTGHPRHPDQSPRDLTKLASGQHPFAVTVGCADSRVAPEILFDQGIGDIFDCRVAGNAVDDLLLGSVEYALEEFTPGVLMVLGHERCGAITATVAAIHDGGTPPGHIGTVIDTLRPIVAPVIGRPGDEVENAVCRNIAAQVDGLLAGSAIVRDRVATGRVALVGARYDLDTGAVTILRR